jgi:hypothetical protein
VQQPLSRRYPDWPVIATLYLIVFGDLAWAWSAGDRQYVPLLREFTVAAVFVALGHALWLVRRDRQQRL